LRWIALLPNSSLAKHKSECRSVVSDWGLYLLWLGICAGAFALVGLFLFIDAGNR
jgi:hypothetical protein